MDRCRVSGIARVRFTRWRRERGFRKYQRSDYGLAVGGTLRSLIRAAELTVDEFLDLL